MAFGRIILSLMALIGCFAFAGDPPPKSSDIQCQYLRPPKVLELDEQTTCTEGKPRTRFLCIGTTRCTAPGYEPKISFALCPMPDGGCDSISAFDCGKANTPGYVLKKMEEVDLDEARTYKRNLRDDGKYVDRSKNSVSPSKASAGGH